MTLDSIGRQLFCGRNRQNDTQIPLPAIFNVQLPQPSKIAAGLRADCEIVQLGQISRSAWRASWLLQAANIILRRGTF